MAAILNWWDGVELWLTGLPFVVQTAVVMPVVLALAFGSAVVLDGALGSGITGCAGCATPRRTNWNPNERYAALTCHVDLYLADRPGHRDVVVHPLTRDPDCSTSATSEFCYSSRHVCSVRQPESHVLALIAVGSRAVADVACCR